MIGLEHYLAVAAALSDWNLRAVSEPQKYHHLVDEY